MARRLANLSRWLNNTILTSSLRGTIMTFYASRPSGAAMSWRLWKPRPIASYEARILRRVIEVDADCLPSAALLASIEHLIVQEEGDGQAHHDSLDFGTTNSHGEIIAIALGTMTNDGHIELFLWADGETITALELEPFDGTRLPIRMPVLESIRPYPADPYGIEVDDEAAVQDSVANPVSD